MAATSPQTGISAATQSDTIMSTSPVNAPVQPLQSPPARVSIAAGSLPIRSASGATTSAGPSAGTSTGYPVRKLVRRDSMERREAFLKGKEGSRQRRRWENDRLLSNPWAEPPLPSDWEIRPTYPRRNIPYYLAPLWDAAEFQRAVEAKLSGGSRRGSAAHRNRNRKHGSLRYPGMSPIEETATSIPKEVKARLKKSRAAKGLLMDLEESVRGWVRGELGDSGKDEAGRARAETMDSVDSGAVVMDETDEEDEEIVFVGRKGVVMDDTAAQPTLPKPTASKPIEIPIRQKHQSPRQEPQPHSSNKEDDQTIHRSKMVFTAPEDDQGASFARWLVHCVGSYYGLRTWSVTREGGVGVKNREAYVGIDERARSFIMARALSGRPLEDSMEVSVTKEIELPRPLWGMV